MIAMKNIRQNAAFQQMTLKTANDRTAYDLPVRQTVK